MHERLVRERLFRVLSRGGATLASICQQMRGVDPVVVRDAIGDSPGQEHATDVRSEPSGSPDLSSVIALVWRGAPEAHPLNFDWYFHHSTLSILLRKLENSKSVLCLGTPRVFVALKYARPSVRAVLVDWNTHLLSHLTTRCSLGSVVPHDLRNGLPEGLHGEFDAAVLDPPWYERDYWLWLRSAWLGVSEGPIVCSLFPDLVRPSARSERQRIISGIRRSASTVSLTPDQFLYETPGFERTAFARRGLNLSSPWRRSDELVAWKSRDSMWRGFVPEDADETRQFDAWHTYVIDRIVIKLRNDVRGEADGDGFALHPPYSDGVSLLRTVSARDPDRNLIDLWVSNGRVYKVTGRRILHRLLSNIESGDSLDSALGSLRQNGASTPTTPSHHLRSALEIILGP